MRANCLNRHGYCCLARTPAAYEIVIRRLGMDVSIIIPTRNRCAFLTQALRSALRQQDVSFEVIVVDEASTDHTPRLLTAVNDPRVRVIRHDVARRLPSARNHGAAQSRGDWLAFLDDDDLWAPDKLVRQLEAAKQTNREWVYTGSVNISNGRIISSRVPLLPEATVADLPRYNAIPGGGSNVVVRRPAWDRTGPFNPRFVSGGEDWDLSIRLSQRGLPACVCSPLIAKRIHGTNMSVTHNIVRLTKLIEEIYQSKADWGITYRWLAHISLQHGRRGDAARQFAKAAVRGQAHSVMSDVSAIIRRRVLRGRHHSTNVAADSWTVAAWNWLRELEVCDAD